MNTHQKQSQPSHSSCNEVQKYYADLLEHGTHSDLTIRSSEKEFKAHKLIVFRCPFFAAACRKGFQEAETNMIDLSGEEPSVVEALVQFLYFYSYPEGLFDKQASVIILFHVKMYAAAEKYFMPDLQRVALDQFEFSLQFGFGNLKWEERTPREVPGMEVASANHFEGLLQVILAVYHDMGDAAGLMRNVVLSLFKGHAAKLFVAAGAPGAAFFHQCPEFARDLATVLKHDIDEAVKLWMSLDQASSLKPKVETS